MSGPPEPSLPSEHDAFWREFLTIGHARERAARRVFVHLPHEPRCRICAAPFAGLAAPVMRLIGKRRSNLNPQLCNSCFTFLQQHRGGADIDCTLLFADIRGSTTIAETMSPSAFRALLDRFYNVAGEAVFGNEGMIDKFVGDEVMAMFTPLLAGDAHAERGVAAARALVRATGHGDSGGPWLPLGAGVLTGRAWVGVVGGESRVELTALGDAVNTAARLAGVARAGEVLVSLRTAEASGLDVAGLEQRTLALKGKSDPVKVFVLS